MKVLLTVLFFIAELFGYAQDTLAYSQLNDTTESREGSYVFKGPPVRVFNGERYVIEEANWYMTAHYVMGRRDGTWQTFRKGRERDTLMHETTYDRDTAQLVVKYSSSGTAQTRQSFANGRMVSMIGYYDTGEKRFEQSGFGWITPLLEGEELLSEYYRNGVLRSVGVLDRPSRRKNGEKVLGFVKRKGDWYYFTEKGELHHMETYRKGRLVKKRTYPTVGDFPELLPF